jgi:CubicO group peptidase (beta-lactamase class C family)
VLGLLRGLTAALDVNQNYLTVMGPYARFSLKNHPLTKGTTTTTTTTTTNVDVVRGEEGILGIKDILMESLDASDVLGAQVCVRRNGVVLVDLSAGLSNPYFLNPVDSDTLFCSFSTSKGVASAAIHKLAIEGKLSFDDPIAKHWKEFTVEGKENITIREVLNHQAGLQNAGTEELTDDPFLCTDENKMISLMASAKPDQATLGKTAYHYLSYGWLLDGIVRAVTGTTIKEFIKSEYKLDIGLNNPNYEATTDTPNVANLVLQKFELPTAVPSASSAAPPPTSTKRPSESVNLLLNPTFFNNPRIQRASIPSANGFFTAGQLCNFYESTAPGIAAMLKKPGNVQTTTAIGERLLQGSEGKFRLGYMLYQEDGDSITYGHSGLGGSVALVRKDLVTGDTLTIAITVNRLQFNAQRSRQIVRHVFRTLGLPIPSTFAD